VLSVKPKPLPVKRYDAFLLLPEAGPAVKTPACQRCPLRGRRAERTTLQRGRGEKALGGRADGHHGLRACRRSCSVRQGRRTTLQRRMGRGGPRGRVERTALQSALATTRSARQSRTDNAPPRPRRRRGRRRRPNGLRCSPGPGEGRGRRARAERTTLLRGRGEEALGEAEPNGTALQSTLAKTR
jgi:hypothetical protein